MKHAKENEKPSEHERKKTVAIIILLLIIVGCLAAIFFISCGKQNEAEEAVESSAADTGGTIINDWDAGIEYSSETSSGKTIVPGYGTATMNEGDTSLKLSLGNPKENTVGFIASLELEDGTVLYTSPTLEPGQGMESVTLSQTLKKGTYSASILFTFVDLDNPDKALNSARSALTIEVK